MMVEMSINDPADGNDDGKTSLPVNAWPAVYYEMRRRQRG